MSASHTPEAEDPLSTDGVATADQTIGLVVQHDLHGTGGTLEQRRSCAIGLASDRSREALAAAIVVITNRLNESNAGADEPSTHRLLPALGILRLAEAFADNTADMAATLATSAGVLELRWNARNDSDPTHWRAELITELVSMPSDSLDGARALVPADHVGRGPFSRPDVQDAALRALDDAMQMRAEFE